MTRDGRAMLEAALHLASGRQWLAMRTLVEALERQPDARPAALAELRELCDPPPPRPPSSYRRQSQRPRPGPGGSAA